MPKLLSFTGRWWLMPASTVSRAIKSSIPEVSWNQAFTGTQLTRIFEVQGDRRFGGLCRPSRVVLNLTVDGGTNA